LITWESVAGQDYFVEGATNLDSPMAWKTLYGVHGADAAARYLNTIFAKRTYTNTLASPWSIFRIRVQ
jgi:hypothetical protein